MIDSTGQGQHAQGITMFTIVAGVGGAIGYTVGGKYALLFFMQALAIRLMDILSLRLNW